MSKKELNDLLNELYESIIERNDLENVDIGADGAITQIDGDDLVTPNKQLEQQTTSPENRKIETSQQATNDSIQVTANETLQYSQSNTSISVRDDLMSTAYFDPNAISTPARPMTNKSNFNDSGQQPANFSMQYPYYDTSNISTNLNPEKAPQYTYQYPLNPMKDSAPILLPFIPLNTTSNSTILPNNLLQNSSSVLLIPQTTFSTSTASLKANNDLNSLNLQIQQGATLKTGYHSKRTRFKNALYSDLERLDVNSIPKYETVSCA